MLCSWHGISVDQKMCQKLPRTPQYHIPSYNLVYFSCNNVSNMSVFLRCVCLIISRAHSPGMAAPSFTGTQRFNVSCHSPSARGHSLQASPNSTLNETALMPEMEPILPDLCIEQLWTETTSSYRLVTTCIQWRHTYDCTAMTAKMRSYFQKKKQYFCFCFYKVLLEVL